MKCKLIEIDVILANGERKVAALGSINIMITFIKVFEGIWLLYINEKLCAAKLLMNNLNVNLRASYQVSPVPFFLPHQAHLVCTF